MRCRQVRWCDRSTRPLAVVVVVFVAILVCILQWSGDSTEGRIVVGLLHTNRIEATPRADAARSARSLSGLEGDVPTAPSSKPMEELIWSPGGIVGPSLADVESELEDLFRVFLQTYITPSTVGGGENNISSWCRPSGASPMYSVKQLQASTTILHGAMQLLQNITTRHHDDCRMHLALHHRAMCFVAAALDTSRDCTVGNPQTSPHLLPLRHRCAYRRSYCAQLMPCMGWTRGSFQRRINASLLGKVYDESIAPKLSEEAAAAGAEDTSAFRAHQTMFLHGDVACPIRCSPPRNQTHNTEERCQTDHRICANTLDAEHQLERLAQQEAYLNLTHERLTTFLNRPQLSARRRFGSNGTAEVIAVEGAESEVPTADVCRLFHQKDVTLAAATLLNSAGSSSHPTSPPAAAAPSPWEYFPNADEELSVVVDGQRLPYLSPMETLAALWRLCSRSAPHRPSSSCVILFHGDSLVREMFTRLVLHLRYGIRGVASTTDRGEFRYAPTHIEVGMFHDIVYRVFPTNDEVLLLENALSLSKAGRPSRTGAPSVNHTTTEQPGKEWTLRTYMDALMEEHQEALKARAEGRRGTYDLPLLHVVFCWDHESQGPRPVGYRRDDLAAMDDSPSAGPDDRRSSPQDEEDDAANLPSQSRGAGRRGTEARDISFASDYPNAADGGPDRPTVVVPLQLLGVTFWQRALHPKLLHLLHRSSGSDGGAAGGDDDGEGPLPVCSLAPEGHPNHLYVMMPLFHNSLHPHLTRLLPALRRTGCTGAPWNTSYVSALHTCSTAAPSGATPSKFNTTARAGSAVEQRGCQHYNIAKTKQWFDWMSDHLQRLPPRRRWSCGIQRDGQRATSNRTTPPLFASVTLFDKGKAPFAGFPMGDHRHCSCHARATVERNLRQYYKSLRSEPVESLLTSWFDPKESAARPLRASQRDPMPDRLIFCGGTVSAVAIGEWFATVARRSADVIYRMQRLTSVPRLAGQPPPTADPAVGDLRAGGLSVRQMFFTAYERPSSASNGKSEFVERQQHWVATYTSPPKSFSSFIGNGRHRCRNPGDLYFLQLVLHDALRRRGPS